MVMAEVPVLHAEKEIKKLLEYLHMVISNTKDRTECLREMVEHEFLPEEMFTRFVQNEKGALLAEIQGYIDLFKGLN